MPLLARSAIMKAMAKTKKTKASAKAKPPVLNLKVAKAPKPVSDSAALDLSPAEVPTSAETTPSQDEASFSDLGPKRSYRWIAYVVAAIIIVAGLFGGFKVVYAQKIYPGVSVNGVFLGGLSKSQAEQTLTSALSTYQKGQILVHYANTTQAVDLATIGTSTDVNAAVDQAYAHGRGGGWSSELGEIARGLIDRPTRIAVVDFDSTKLMPYINTIADAVDTPVANASLSFADTGRVEVVPAQAGQRLDIGALVTNLEQRIGTGSTDTITAPVNNINPAISTTALDAVKSQADNYLQGPLTLNLAGQTRTVAVADMIGWLKVNQAPQLLPNPNPSLASFAPPASTPPVSLAINTTAVGGYVAGLAKIIDQPGQNAALTITNNVATVFQPEKTGYILDQPGAVSIIEAALAKPASARTLALNVKVTEPAVTAASLNSLGINQLISEGVTTFPGSPSVRIQNIRVGASKFNGVLVAPNATFSFEDLLGDVGPETGYAPAIVIVGNKEEYQYGGGLCQVSTTAYRAALLAGLPIVERHSHSYAVSYYTAPYGIPGVDATVYDASVDFKFLNNTGHYILIQTILSGSTLKFDFYGTKVESGVIRGPYFVDPAGGAGWNPTVPSTTVFYRDILDASGNVTKTDTITTHYASSNDFPLTPQFN